MTGGSGQGRFEEAGWGASWVVVVVVGRSAGGRLSCAAPGHLATLGIWEVVLLAAGRQTETGRYAHSAGVPVPERPASLQEPRPSCWRGVMAPTRRSTPANAGLPPGRHHQRRSSLQTQSDSHSTSTRRPRPSCAAKHHRPGTGVEFCALGNKNPTAPKRPGFVFELRNRSWGLPVLGLPPTCALPY